MLAVADRAGGEWPEKARQAAIAVSKVVGAADASNGVRLLADVRDIFSGKDNKDDFGNVLFQCPRIASSELVNLLGDMNDRPWAEWKNGKPLTETGLARLLRPFGVVPQQKQIDGIRFRGYFRADFEDAWERYILPPLLDS
jgi:hypothetical protein